MIRIFTWMSLKLDSLDLRPLCQIFDMFIWPLSWWGGGAKIGKMFCPDLGYLIGCFRVHPVFALSESDPGKFICNYASKHCSECILVPCHGVALQDKPLKVLHRGSEDCGGDYIIKWVFFCSVNFRRSIYSS